jgi:uncharacterized BrkB/YihY/UPF0761 family membrane protein
VDGVVEVGKRVIGNYLEHRMGTFAVALAYRSLFALFPFLLLMVVLLGFFGPPTQPTGSSLRPKRNQDRATANQYRPSNQKNRAK